MKQKPQSRIRVMAAAFALSAVLMSSLAFAQQAGPRGQGGPGGPGQAGPQFGQGQRPGMMRGGLMILQRPDVQKELKLSEEQIEKIRQLTPPMGRPGGGPDTPPPTQGQGRRGEGQPGQPANPGDMEAKVKEILNPGQYTRYKELEIQFVGASIVLREDIARNLHLTDEQVEKIRAILPAPGGPGGPGVGGPGGPGGRGGNGGVGGVASGGAGAGAGQRPPQRGTGGPGGPGGPGQMPPMNDEMRKERDAKILAILTSQQREKFETMKGKPFKFEQMRPPARPGE